MKVYGPFVRTLKVIFRGVRPGWTAEMRNDPNEPAVYIVHHQNMFGPLHAIGILPVEMHMWSLHNFCDHKKCFDQFYTFTYTKRYGWPRPVAWCMARLLSRIVPAILHSARVFPVYHDANSLSTMRKSMDALRRGESIVICPDIAYDDPSPAMGEMYPGFLLLSRMYAHAQDGKALPYVPVYASKKLRKVVCGEPLRFKVTPDFADRQAEMETSLRDAVNSLGCECGDIEYIH